MTEDEKKELRKIKTPPFRMSFPWLLAPKEEKGDNGVVRKVYQLAMLFPPGFDDKPFRAALRQAMVEKHGADTSKWPSLRHKPDDVIRDFAAYNRGTKKPLPGDWTGWVMIRANATEKFPPSIIGPVKGTDGTFPRISDAREVYSGRWARATLDAFKFDTKGGGVTFGLRNVQLLKHDTNFSGAVTRPEDDFDDADESMLGDEFDRGGDTAATNGGGW